MEIIYGQGMAATEAGSHDRTALRMPRLQDKGQGRGGHSGASRK